NAKRPPSQPNSPPPDAAPISAAPPAVAAALPRLPSAPAPPVAAAAPSEAVSAPSAAVLAVSAAAFAVVAAAAPSCCGAPNSQRPTVLPSTSPTPSPDAGGAAPRSEASGPAAARDSAVCTIAIKPG